jgi:ribosomal protein S18 acetylase RimI-like enzyme
MLEITNRDWKDTDLDEVSTLTFNSLQNSTFFQAERTLHKVREWLNWSYENFPPTSKFLAHIKGNLVGWLTVTLDTKPHISEMWRWVPYISPEVKGQKDEIAEDLIRICVEFVRTQGQTRLEVCFDRISEATMPQYKQYKAWFETEGVYKVDETAYMRKSLDAREFTEYDLVLPPSYIYKPLVDVDLEALYNCYNRAFLDSKIRVYHDMTEKERRADFGYYFESRNKNEEASFVVVKECEIVGFSLVHSRPNEAHLADIGIVQAHRGKGLGRRVLKHSMIKAAQDYDTMTLAVDVENTVVYDFCVDLGFEGEYRNITHAWKHN